MAFVALLAVYALLRLTIPTSGLTLLVLFAVYITGIILGFRLLKRNVPRMVWRLRNRLIVAYLFIAVVPVVLIFLLVMIGGYILTGQAAVYIVGKELEQRTAVLNETAWFLAGTAPDKREALVQQMGPLIESRLPGVELLVRGKREIRYPPGAGITSPPAGWQNASGLVVKDRAPYSWAHVKEGDAEVTLLAPLSPELLADVAPTVGQVYLDTLEGAASGARAAAAQKTRRINRIPLPANRFDINVFWVEVVYFPRWDAPDSQAKGALAVQTRPSAVLGALFQRVDVSQFWLVLFLIVAGIFVIVELFSLKIGVSITRTITGAVQNLYEGTEWVRRGDFSHRIAVAGNDQLAELGHLFNRMTENLERLILVEKEQERLKAEIEIAREVQSQLFPRGAPAMKTLELTGVCHPARMVSGDYYDFLRTQDSRVALAIGDVAGKGISAALLMAAIQSIMRTQLTAGVPVHAMAAHEGGNGHAWLASTADLVSQLNKQVYANTAPEKYATFCFGLYDDESRVLSYTNAGHVPPILLRDGAAVRLEVTGTVVGAFAAAPYEERRVELRPGDLLVAFTDGIVEPENEYGEAFGEQRLVDLLLRYGKREAEELIARVMETVEHWTSSSELFDDMTLVVARAI